MGAPREWRRRGALLAPRPMVSPERWPSAATASPERSWRPILDGKLARHARKAIEAIATDLEHSAIETEPEGRAGRTDRAEQATLACGDAGLALFFDYLGVTLPGRPPAGGIASRLLDRARQAAAQVEMTPSLHEGFTGVGWALEHLK